MSAMAAVDCEQSLSFPSVFLAFLRASVELWMSSARGGFQEQKPTTRSLLQLQHIFDSEVNHAIQR